MSDEGGAALWLDPGGTTGMAAWFFETGEFRSWQEDFKGTGARIESLAFHVKHLSIGYEQYNISPGRYVRHDGSSLMVIGMTRWLALVHGASMLPSQPPSARNLGLKHLKVLGWHRPGLGHANDAAAHLASWAISNDLLPEELKERLRGNSRA